ncbi:MAG TPA: trypsin-like peptidase domain-containing protein [Patescibacteria group bacterium]|nr:trypsin-like peptidase domain-containing protein [Patescibacteria group bacterium]
MVLISLVCGAVGGAGGAIYALHSPRLQKLLFPASATVQNVTLNEDSAIVDVVKKASPAVVSIVISEDLNKLPGYSLDPFSQGPFSYFFGGGGQQQPSQNSGGGSSGLQEIGAGSGFFVSADGLILTNKHVVSNDSASYTVLTSDGQKYDAKVLARDPVSDLAIVKVDISNAPYLRLAGSAGLEIGQRVIAIGNSLGQYQNTVTSGIISGTGRSITAGNDSGGDSEQLSGVIQTDAAINPGNSGGPLLNVAGDVVGINTAIDEQGQLVGFAIPSQDAAKALDSFEKNGKILRPFLGVRYLIITQALAEEQKLPENYGALIVRGDTATDFAVVPGSPADKAGLQENDIILQVNGQKVDEDHGLADLLKDADVGQAISLQVYHKGKVENLQVTLGQTQ